jgi:Dyp-type peroxidase family
VPGQSPVKAGEFIIGYENEYEELNAIPTVAESWDRMGYLQPNRQQTNRRDLGRNGSYLVVRKLVQDVRGFWAFFEEAARKERSADVEFVKLKLASKCVGRWPSGAPLVLSPEEDRRELAMKGRNNLFDYMGDDPFGLSCPIGSHIRRANPRDSLPPDPVTSLKILKRHRIIRRGRAFGESLSSIGRTQASNDERGLMFVAINANFETQFEFIQRNWIQGSAFGGLSGEVDPLLGSGNGTMTIPERPLRRLLGNIPRFVTTRGGGYFFLPGVSALKFLTALG